MKPATILICKLGAIGDVVLSLPMLQALRAREPQARITFLVGRAAAPVLEKNPAIDDLWVIDENDFWKKRFYALIKIFLAIRKHSFDRVYILQWSSLFHAFFWLTGIPERIGFSRDGHAFGLTCSVPYYEAHSAHHDVDLYQSLVDISLESVRSPQLVLLKEEVESAEARWKKLGAQPGQRRIAIAPGGGSNAKLVMPMKRWPLEHYKTLIQKLRAEQNALVILLGSEEERTLLEQTNVPSEINLAGQLSLRETAALIKQAHFFVGNDSGLAHIASAVGTASVVFFGPTSPHGKKARGTPQQILYRQEVCSPCYRFGHAPACPYELKCLTQIKPEEAMNAIERLSAAKVS